MIDFKNNDLWNKEKLHQTIRYIKDNCTLNQVTSQYNTLIYCRTNREYKNYNTILVKDRKTNEEYRFTSFKNLVSYFYQYVL